MTVYVDDVEHEFGRMKMCHMWSESLDELLAMADTIGVQRKWIQGHPVLSFGKHRNASWVHFDIAKGKRALAIKAGAVLTDQYGPVVHTCNLTIAHSESPEAVQRAKDKLETIARIRFREATEAAKVDAMHFLPTDPLPLPFGQETHAQYFKRVKGGRS